MGRFFSPDEKFEWRVHEFSWQLIRLGRLEMLIAGRFLFN